MRLADSFRYTAPKYGTAHVTPGVSDGYMILRSGEEKDNDRTRSLRPANG